MNDNIERLCEELLHYDDMIFGWRKTVERAAEAIVRECAVLCRWEHEAHAMLEHFGVEE